MIKIILGIFSVCILCVNNVLANDNEYNKEVEYDVVLLGRSILDRFIEKINENTFAVCVAEVFFCAKNINIT